MTDTDLLAAVDDVERCGGDSSQLDAVLDALAHPHKQVQRRAAKALSHHRDLRPRIVQRLAMGDDRARWGAAYALSLFPEPAVEAVAALLTTLASKDGDVRWAARDILMHLPDTADLASHLLALASKGNAEQRKMAAYSLRDLAIAAPATQEAALCLLRDEQPAVRLAALSCLAKVAIDRSQVATAIAAHLSDTDAGVARAAAAALGTLGVANEAIRAALGAVVDSADLSLGRAARNALQRLAYEAST